MFHRQAPPTHEAAIPDHGLAGTGDPHESCCGEVGL